MVVEEAVVAVEALVVAAVAVAVERGGGGFRGMEKQFYSCQIYLCMK